MLPATPLEPLQSEVVRQLHTNTPPPSADAGAPTASAHVFASEVQSVPELQVLTQVFDVG